MKPRPYPISCEKPDITENPDITGRFLPPFLPKRVVHRRDALRRCSWPIGAAFVANYGPEPAQE